MVGVVSIDGDYLGQKPAARRPATILTDMLLTVPGVTLDDLARSQNRIRMHMQELIDSAMGDLE